MHACKISVFVGGECKYVCMNEQILFVMFNTSVTYNSAKSINDKKQTALMGQQQQPFAIFIETMVGKEIKFDS